jgi:hypothetical protein
MNMKKNVWRNRNKWVALTTVAVLFTFLIVVNLPMPVMALEGSGFLADITGHLANHDNQGQPVNHDTASRTMNHDSARDGVFPRDAGKEESLDGSVLDDVEKSEVADTPLDDSPSNLAEDLNKADDDSIDNTDTYAASDDSIDNPDESIEDVYTNQDEPIENTPLDSASKEPDGNLITAPDRDELETNQITASDNPEVAVANDLYGNFDSIIALVDAASGGESQEDFSATGGKLQEEPAGGEGSNPSVSEAEETTLHKYPVTSHFGKYRGVGTLTATIDAPFSKFTNLTYQGGIVAKSNYEVAEGSTVIILSEAYLNTLSEGDHSEFVAIFTDGESGVIKLSVDDPHDAGLEDEDGDSDDEGDGDDDSAGVGASGSLGAGGQGASGNANSGSSVGQPRTSDDMSVWLYAVFAFLSFSTLGITLFAIRRRRRFIV